MTRVLFEEWTVMILYRNGVGRASWQEVAPLFRSVISRKDRPEWHDWRWQCRAGSALGGKVASILNWPANAVPVSITPYYVSLFDLDRLERDPLAIQSLPDPRENSSRNLPGGDCADPFGEMSSTLPGLAHRFADRLLVRFSHACATYCRHCTRRHLIHAPGQGEGGPAVEALVAYINRHPVIREVIVSGGDPLLSSDRQLLALIKRLSAIAQLDAIRIGTRTPVVLPMRVNRSLAAALGRLGKVWVNTQFNHPREITPQAAGACSLLVDSGIPVSNQTVLLSGVNDSIGTLHELCAGLQRIRVRPYYVFIGDPVAGTAHLRVPLEVGQGLELALEKRIGGLAMPKFVADIPGAAAKVPLNRLPAQD